jgi:Sec-independent protein secretion pathway component TatC
MISELPRSFRRHEPDPRYMTWVGHLEELRRRLVVAILAIGAGSVVGWFAAQILPFASDYVGFISLILAVFGLSYELPLVLVSLSAAGIISSHWLASKRIVAFFACFVFAMVVTPGADFVSPLILGSILYVLFECSIVVSRLIGR